MSIPIPSGMTRGRVSWRIAHDRAGATLPGASGRVRFEPTARAVSYSDTTVLPEPVETPVIGGVMTPVSLTVNDPEIWNWRVHPHVGVPWPPFPVDVAGPVDLSAAAVVPGKGPVRAVKGQTGESAYEVARRHGYTGSETEWLASLKGEKGSASWATITGKPTTYPPDTHRHAVADVTGLQDALDGKVGTGDSRLTDARTPTAHRHALADVDGLQTALDGKAPKADPALLDTGWRQLTSWTDTGVVTGMPLPANAIPLPGSPGSVRIRRYGQNLAFRIVGLRLTGSATWQVPQNGWAFSKNYMSVVGRTAEIRFGYRSITVSPLTGTTADLDRYYGINGSVPMDPSESALAHPYPGTPA